MEREHLYRGKRVDSGEWVYGDLLHICGGTVIYHGSKTESEIKANSGACIELFESEVSVVDPKTVGEYIGGKGFMDSINEHFIEDESEYVKLFEGDIVEAWSQGSKGRFVIKKRIESQPIFMLYPAWQFKIMWSINFSDIGRKKGDYYDDLRVIGNIHDNPELFPNKQE